MAPRPALAEAVRRRRFTPAPAAPMTAGPLHSLRLDHHHPGEGGEPSLGIEIEPWDPDAARGAFLGEFRGLTDTAGS